MAEGRDPQYRHLLKAVDPQRSACSASPTARATSEGMHMLENAHLKSVMWNIDSLDWADPVPSSIADRVLRTVDKEGRGIILFHDIHERTVKALPPCSRSWRPRATSLPAGTAAASR
jgi:peptidoglycan/xylan/chitin deacetylase (PgdA/CDA1 family)